MVPGSNLDRTTMVPGINLDRPTMVPGSNLHRPTMVPGSNLDRPTMVPGKELHGITVNYNELQVFWGGSKDKDFPLFCDYSPRGGQGRENAMNYNELQ